MLHRSIRWVLRATAALGLVLASVGVTAPAAQATHIDARDSFIQWNMCGRRCNLGSYGPADALVTSAQARSPLPYAVMVEEICRRQWDRIRNSLQPNGFATTSVFVTTLANAANCGGSGVTGDYGIAVFFRGGRNAEYIKQFAYNPEAEKRTMACADAITPAYYACVTHLDDDQANAQQQAPEAHDIAQWYSACCKPAFVGGDFNLEPNNNTPETGPGASLDSFYADFNEGDGDSRVYGTAMSDYRYTTDVYTSRGRSVKIDYIFVPDRTHYIIHDVYIGDSTWSDHQLYQAYPYRRPGT